MTDELVEVARFGSANEAAIARSVLEGTGIAAVLHQEATATWLWHYGTALGGVKLLVRSADADEARTILADQVAEPADAGTRFGAVTHHQISVEDEEDDSDGVDPTLVRAWRAAIIGIAVVPPLLSLYSLWLLVRHGLLLSGQWRAIVAFMVDLAVLGAIGLFLWAAR